jgi:hypothetical protein
MFGSKSAPEVSYAGLASETPALRALDREAHQWLGAHYRWYHEVRNAKRGEFQLFSGENLEEQLLATRGALSGLTAALNAGLVSAYNQVVEAVAKSEHVPAGMPAKIDMPDRNNPPATGAAEDAIIICYSPIKFLALAKNIRDKGKGLPFYADGLIKKLWFKVIGFYCDPSHWDATRLGHLVGTVPGDAQLGDVQQRLTTLKSDVDLLMSTVQMFRFGGAKLGPSGEKNTTEELYKSSDAELVAELYLQSIVLHGLEQFLFRYYVTLLGEAKGGRVIRHLSQIFQPIIQRVEEVRLQFQASFATERDKMRLRPLFQDFYKEHEQKTDAVHEIDGEKVPVRFSNRLVDQMALARGAKLSQGQAHAWAEALKNHVLGKIDTERGCAFLVEILNTLVNSTRLSVEGKLKVAKQLREFAYDQEKLGAAQIKARRRQVDEQKKLILRRAAKFKTDKQPEAAAAYEAQAAKLEQEAEGVFTNMQQAVDRRRDQLLARVEQMETQAKEDGETNTGRSAAAVYQILTQIDSEKKVRTHLLPYLMQVIQEEKDDTYHTLYRFLFGVLPDLAPTEKMVLRKLVASKMKLGDDELVVTEQELKDYQQIIVTRKTELMQETPALLDYKLVQGPVQLKLDQLLGLGLNAPSLILLLQMPLNPPNKPPAKLPGPIVRKVLMLNQLINPLPEHDVTLPNVEQEAPIAKKINFNRLAKLSA